MTQQRKQDSGGVALIGAIKRKDMRAVRKLLSDGADPNAARSSNYVGNVTPLMVAAGIQSAGIVEMLLRAGANPNARRIPGAGDRFGAGSALHEAIIGSDFGKEKDDPAVRLRIVDLLLNAGADINAIARGDTTPLCAAAEEGHPAIVQRLISGGADPSNWPEGSDPPLTCAANGCHLRIARLLVEKGAPVDGETSVGATALMVAAHRGCVSVLRLLLDHGADVNHRANDGRTPLICAARFARDATLGEEHERAVAMVGLLVKAGAEVNAKDKEGRTALDFASDAQNPAAYEFLRLLSKE